MCAYVCYTHTRLAMVAIASVVYVVCVGVINPRHICSEGYGTWSVSVCVSVRLFHGGG